jgi:hypothetical protein
MDTMFEKRKQNVQWISFQPYSLQLLLVILLCLRRKRFNVYNIYNVYHLLRTQLLSVYLSLFILATGCPYERVLQKSNSHFRFRGIVQDTDTEICPNPETYSGCLECQVFQHSNAGSRFKISTERLLSNFSWPARESNSQCRNNKSHSLTDRTMRTGMTHLISSVRH